MRRAIARPLIILILLAVPILSGCQSKSEKLTYSANETLKQALQASGQEKAKLFSQAHDQLQEAIKLDPNNLDAYKLLGQIDDVTGNSEEATKVWEKASELDPTDQKLLQQARMYKARQEMIDNASKAVDQIKSGDVEGGMRALKDALVATRTPDTRAKVVGILQEAVPDIIKVGDQQVQDKKYPDALKTYDQALRGYMLLAEATKKPTLDPGADALMHSANEAAKAAGTPDATFRMLNDALTVDPDNKVANMELAQVYLRRTPPDYETAADLEERAGAPDADVAKLRAEAKRHRKK
jgi:tetratricopeptide (TPR) repeat protein